MQRLKENTFGIAESRWAGKEETTSDGMTFIYSGRDRHQARLALILDEGTSKSFPGTLGKLSERVINGRQNI